MSAFRSPAVGLSRSLSLGVSLSRCPSLGVCLSVCVSRCLSLSLGVPLSLVRFTNSPSQTQCAWTTPFLSHTCTLSKPTVKTYESGTWTLTSLLARTQAVATTRNLKPEKKLEFIRALEAPNSPRVIPIGALAAHIHTIGVPVDDFGIHVWWPPPAGPSYVAATSALLKLNIIQLCVHAALNSRSRDLAARSPKSGMARLNSNIMIR